MKSKKIIAAMLTISCICCMLPFSTFAEQRVSGSDMSAGFDISSNTDVVSEANIVTDTAIISEVGKTTATTIISDTTKEDTLDSVSDANGIVEETSDEKNGWVFDGVWRYYENNQPCVGWKNNIPNYVGLWFYFDLNSGNMLTSWQNNIPGYQGSWFYFDTITGIMATSWKNTIPGYEGKWFYFDTSSGIMSTSWKTGIPSYENYWFYFDLNSGVMKTGWASDISGWEGSKFFFDLGTGVMYTGLHTMSRVNYNFADNGVLLSPNNTDFVLVLDPGHGADEDGAKYTYNGVEIKEKDLNMKIAKYQREYLQSYKTEDGQNIKVLLTHETDHTSGTDTNPKLKERVMIGKNSNAQSVISLHCNASSDGSRAFRGSMVLVTSSHYVAEGSRFGDLYSIEENLSRNILSSLQKLGLALSSDLGTQNGLLRRLSDDGSKYPNGETTDWYGIIYNGVDNAIPSILVEHAYLDNESDYNEYLSTDEKLQKLALADTQGIAQYYNLQKF